MNMAGKACLLLFSLAVIGCRAVEDPNAHDLDTSTELYVDADANTCPNWNSEIYHPWWKLLLIETTGGPPIGIDAVVITHPCTNETFCGTGLAYKTDANEASATDLSQLLFFPDATGGDCAGRFVTMDDGDLVAIKLLEAIGPGDVVEVFVVEPDGTCAEPPTSSQIKLSIVNGFDFAVPIGEGNVATIPVDLMDRQP